MEFNYKLIEFLYKLIIKITFNKIKFNNIMQKNNKKHKTINCQLTIYIYN